MLRPKLRLDGHLGRPRKQTLNRTSPHHVFSQFYAFEGLFSFFHDAKRHNTYFAFRCDRIPLKLNKVGISFGLSSGIQDSSGIVR